MAFGCEHKRGKPNANRTREFLILLGLRVRRFSRRLEWQNRHRALIRCYRRCGFCRSMPSAVVLSAKMRGGRVGTCPLNYLLGRFLLSEKYKSKLANSNSKTPVDTTTFGDAPWKSSRANPATIPKFISMALFAVFISNPESSLPI
jgi:hypothetical protein